MNVHKPFPLNPCLRDFQTEAKNMDRTGFCQKVADFLTSGPVDAQPDRRMKFKGLLESIGGPGTKAGDLPQQHWHEVLQLMAFCNFAQEVKRWTHGKKAQKAMEDQMERYITEVAEVIHMADHQRDLLRSAIRSGTLTLPEPELCVDEGCDHHGTDHICVTTIKMSDHAISDIIKERKLEEQAAELGLADAPPKLTLDTLVETARNLHARHNGTMMELHARMRKEHEDLKAVALSDGLDADIVAILLRHEAYESSKALLQQSGLLDK
jgi:hypothetical protein